MGFRSTGRVRTPRLTIMLPLCGAVALAFTAGLPFFFLHPDQGLIVSLYEGMSLITTNGSSAYEGAYDGLQAIILWRGLVAWLGGYVAICITLSFLTSLNIGGLQLHQSPMPFGDNIAGYPRLRATAMALYPAYVAVTVTCFIFLWLTGLSFFEALVMAFATISSTGLYMGAVEGLNSFPVQFVLAIFMMLTVMNWDLHYARYSKRRINVGRDTEAATLALSVVFIASLLMLFAGNLSGSGLWHSLFASISAISTTGLIPGNFFDGAEIPMSVGLVLLLAAGIGGSVIGTGGGLKQLRAIVVYRAGRSEVDRLAHPHGVTSLSVGNVEAQKHDIEAVWLLLGSFVLVLAIGSLLLAVLGIHFQDALSMAFTALTLSGPLISSTNPSFGGFSGLQDADYIILTALMLFGRIETSLLLALFAKSLWRA